MTTYVYVMYVLDKHVHALNLFFISIFVADFSPHVRVCRLILKKNHHDYTFISTLYTRGHISK